MIRKGIRTVQASACHSGRQQTFHTFHTLLISTSTLDRHVYEKMRFEQMKAMVILLLLLLLHRADEGYGYASATSCNKTSARISCGDKTQAGDGFTRLRSQTPSAQWWGGEGGAVLRGLGVGEGIMRGRRKCADKGTKNLGVLLSGARRACLAPTRRKSSRRMCRRSRTSLP